jgi:murein DD-endopeptidase MepM/ murein hydrolase activator NlpD
MRKVLFLVALLFVFAAPAAAWVKPVAGPVVRPFEPPRTRFGPGHLGVDFAAPPTSPVRAAGPGIVVFAGRVGDELDVVIRHAGGLRTTYAFLSAITVHAGETVRAGGIIGRSGGHGTNHDGNVLHLGLRVENTYVDPMQLFRPPDLGAVVHLAPLDRGNSPG